MSGVIYLNEQGKEIELQPEDFTAKCLQCGKDAKLSFFGAVLHKEARCGFKCEDCLGGAYTCPRPTNTNAKTANARLKSLM